jgi:group I intron endonuclease
MRSYGVEFFTFNIISDGINDDELNCKEEEYIKSFNSVVPNGYNIRTGGSHTLHSEETRRKIGEKSKGRQATLGQKRTEEQKRNIGNASRGRKVGKERMEKQRASINEWHKNNPIAHKNCKYTIDDVRYIRSNPDNLTIKEFSIKFKSKPYEIKQIIDKKKYKYVVS